MKKNLLLIVWAVIVFFGLGGQAAATPVVQVDSSYSVDIEGAVSDNFFSAVGPFDGAPKSFVRAGVNLILTESDTDLGGGINRITLDLAGDGELFTSSGEQAFLSVGVEGDGLNLLMPVSLDEARIRLFDAFGGLLFESDNLAIAAEMGHPWDGFFPAPGSVIGIDGAGGAGINRVAFEFQVSAMPAAVPEPVSLLLFGVAFAAAGAVRRGKISA